MLPALLLLLLLLARAARATMAPAIYWHTSPAAAGATALFAGAFGADDAAAPPTAFLCADGAACGQPQPLAASLAHERSVAFAYPRACAEDAAAHGNASGVARGSGGGGGCAFKLCASGGDTGACTVVGDPNAPDLWWAGQWPPTEAPGTTLAPGAVSPRGDGATLVRRGTRTVLRVFGRALAFAPSAADPAVSECVAAGVRNAPAPATVLALGGGAAPVAAFAATCFEAYFDLTAALLSAPSASEFPDAAVSNAFGAAPLPLAVLPVRAPAAPLAVFDVDAAFGGNLSTALAAAAGAPAGDKLVVLGPRTYALTAPVSVPPNTTLAGAGSAGASASVLTFALPTSPGGSGPAVPAVSGSDDWGLRDLAIVVTSAPPGCPGVSHEAGGRNFTALRVAVSLVQANVSNGFRLLGTEWEVGYSSVVQAGTCLWPPTSDTTNFPISVALRLQGSADGAFHHIAMKWSCGGMDMDCSQRVVYEDCDVAETNAGVFPHGNSISSYSQLGGTPYSQSYFYAHNTQTRPPNNNKTDWGFHETLTTDGPGGWGGGPVSALDGAVVSLGGSGLRLAEGKIAGASAIVITGPGAGQYRAVTRLVNATALELAQPFDMHVVPSASIVVVLGTVGGKIVADNNFVWGSVVQAFGVTLTGVYAGNSFLDQNNAGADAGDVDGSLTGFGLCYVGTAAEQARLPPKLTDPRHSLMNPGVHRDLRAQRVALLYTSSHRARTLPRRSRSFSFRTRTTRWIARTASRCTTSSTRAVMLVGRAPVSYRRSCGGGLPRPGTHCSHTN